MCESYNPKKVSFVSGLLTNPNVHRLENDECDFVSGLIVGGEKAKNGEFPHMAAMGTITIDGKEDFFCGGSLISELFVLTAAHCTRLTNANAFARLGDQNIRSTDDGVNEVDVPIVDFIKHEGYSRSTRQHDIAVAKLQYRVGFSKTIRPACLWQKDEVPTQKAVASGWGHTEYGGSSSAELMKVLLDVRSIRDCQNLFDDDGYVINDNQICAGSKSVGDTCQGGE